MAEYIPYIYIWGMLAEHDIFYIYIYIYMGIWSSSHHRHRRFQAYGATTYENAGPSPEAVENHSTFDGFHL